MIAIEVAKSEPKNVDICQILNFKIDFFWQRECFTYVFYNVENNNANVTI